MKNELIREWIEKADEDYEAASVLFAKKNKKFFNVVCFHAQQAAEKYIKAFLVLHQVDFPKTHDLPLLVKLCMKIDPEFELIMDLARFLNLFSVDLRYPGDKSSHADAKKAFATLTEIRSFFQIKLALKNLK